MFAWPLENIAPGAGPREAVSAKRALHFAEEPVSKRSRVQCCAAYPTKVIHNMVDVVRPIQTVISYLIGLLTVISLFISHIHWFMDLPSVKGAILQW